MSRIRFLADHDFNDGIVTGLWRCDLAIEITRAREVGLAKRDDPDVLAYAAEKGFLVVSHDRNTMPGHAYDRLRGGLSMPGLFVAKQRGPLRPTVYNLFLIWSASEAEECNGKVIYLPL